jgi:hypothetical protein
VSTAIEILGERAAPVRPESRRPDAGA